MIPDGDVSILPDCPPRQCNHAIYQPFSLKAQGRRVLQQHHLEKIRRKPSVETEADFTPSVNETVELLRQDGHYGPFSGEFLKGAADSIRINRQVATGIIPKEFTAWIECSHCGHVPVDASGLQKVIGCPWCHSLYGRMRDHVAIAEVEPERERLAHLRTNSPETEVTKGDT